MTGKHGCRPFSNRVLRIGAMVLLCSSSGLPAAQAANCAPFPPTCVAMNPDADVVQLRKDCTGQINCCTDTPDLARWIGSCRTPPVPPATAPPLRVSIGPGDFAPLKCEPSTGPYAHVSFIGSGLDQTRFTVTCTHCPDAGLWVTHPDCGVLEFKDLTIVGSQWGIFWSAQSGDSLWTNTRIIGEAAGWYEFTSGLPCATNNLATHEWFNSRIESTGTYGAGAQAYQANCGLTHLYNTDLIVNLAGSTSYNAEEGVAALTIGANPDLDTNRRAEVTLTASTARVVGPTWTGTTIDAIVAAIRVYPNGTVQMNDGIINIDVAGDNPTAVYALRVEPAFSAPGISLPAGVANTAGAAFNVVRSGAETAIAGTWRVGDPSLASLQAPYLWPAATDIPRPKPASIFQVGSMGGADVFVETDCDGAGCDATGNQPHMLLYNEFCPSKWFDSTNKTCRPQSP
jgi:hypothetical protein